MLEYLFNPVEALKKIQKEKIGKFWLYLLISAILIWLGALIGKKSLVLPQMNIGVLIIVAIVGVFVFTIVMSWFLQILAKLLFGKAEYNECFKMFAVMIIPVAVALFLYPIFSYIPYVGAILNALLIALTVVYTFGLFYKAGMTFWKVDVVTMLIVDIIITLAFLFAVSFALKGLFMPNIPFVPGV